MARVFLKGRLERRFDRLTALALDHGSPESVRLAAVTAVSDLEASTVKPLWEALGEGPKRGYSTSVNAGAAEQRAEARRRRRDQLMNAAQPELPDDPEALRQLLAPAGPDAPLPTLHRDRRADSRAGTAAPPARAPSGRAPAAPRTWRWPSARAASGLYDLRESLEGASAAAGRVSGGAVNRRRRVVPGSDRGRARARRRTTWWREHLADAFHAIVAREGLTRRHAVMKKIEKRWGGRQRWPLVAGPASALAALKLAARCVQYAFANHASTCAGVSQRTQRPSAGGGFIGMLRIVACVSVLICASQSADAAPGRDHEPGPAFHRLLELVVGRPTRCVCSSRNATRALEQRPLDLVEQLAHAAPARPSIGDAELLARVAARRAAPATSRCPSDRSRGAAARRAAPTRQNFQPGRSSRSSSVTRMPAATSSLLDLLRLRQHGLAPVVAADRHDDHLIRRDRAAAAPGRCRRRAS